MGRERLPEYKESAEIEDLIRIIKNKAVTKADDGSAYMTSDDSMMRAMLSIIIPRLRALEDAIRSKKL